MRPDPDLDAYEAHFADSYQDLNYGRSLSAFFMRKGHEWLERPFDPTRHFGRVIEVGAGSGQHIGFIRHGFDEYLLTDRSSALLDRAGAALPEDRRARVRLAREDATRLSLADGSVDRLIACHVLEHLHHPHDVLREWYRVLRKNGVLSILLPCDPGVLWRVGRMFGPRANAERVGIEYDYWMAREHVNPINNLIVFIRYYFDAIVESWYPTHVASPDLNLFYMCHVTKT